MNVFARNFQQRETLGDSVFSLLYCQLVEYHQNRVKHVDELERRLHAAGYEVGLRLCDKFFFKERGMKRETRVLDILLRLKTHFWRHLFCKEADQLDQATDKDGMYYLTEFDNVVVRHTLTSNSLSAAAFLAGIASAFLHGSGFKCDVKAVWPRGGVGVSLAIEFDESVLQREKMLEEKR